MTDAEYNYYWMEGYNWWKHSPNTSNPYPKYTPQWFAWRDGSQEYGIDE